MTSDIPFARDDAQRMLPAMIACLVGFAALLLATGLSLSNTLDAQTRDVAGVFQIEVPSETPAGTNDKVITLLRTVSGVEDVKMLDQGEMETLLKPWLGSDFALGNLPVPTLIEIKTSMTAKGSAVDMPSLRKSLEGIDKSIHIADRSPWVEQLATALHLLQALVMLVALLLLICVIGMVVLVARTNLKLHFKTVGLLHMFGATDDYILRQFQWNGAGLAARGAFAGVGAAAVVFGMAVILSVEMHSPVIPAIHFTIGHFLAFLMLPLFTAAVALVATRVTVRAMLHHLH
ncbi:MAG: hypothetical protein B7X02_01475 [Rhodospirillales bacterium 12-54-5]|nr:MAG: hypothetical protein B7X02_01475 [Rhodospirillales bacterium 12-54-5]